MRCLPFATALLSICATLGAIAHQDRTYKQGSTATFRAALDFLDVLRPGDQLMIAGFDHRTRTLTELTDDRNQLESALLETRPNSTTSLFDSLYITLKTLAHKSRDSRRRMALVVVSDGQDTSSMLESSAILNAIDAIWHPDLRHIAPAADVGNPAGLIRIYQTQVRSEGCGARVRRARVRV